MSLIIPVSQIECQTKSWKSYLKEAISDPYQLLDAVNLTTQQLTFELDEKNNFALRVPQPFIDKMVQGDPLDPLFLQVITQAKENLEIDGYGTDPLLENSSELPGLLHKYQGRALLILSSACAINCRYCFRRHFPYQDKQASGSQLEQALDYINKTTSLTEIILSGGDPLIVSDNLLETIIDKLARIPHLKRLRIHTRLPVVIPQRITKNLVKLLKQTRLQVSLVLHINHAQEIDDLLTSKLALLKQNNVQLLNQSVLLKGINDNAGILIDLSEKLFGAGVLPYYIHLLDKVSGAAHFDSDEKTAVELIQSLREALPGYLVPRLAREESGKKAKTIII